ncbi:MAG TPA: hypothetical protein DCF63_10925 [Planctomycetaceae bacterium]|nr:hypothetical protein [Planctomycetaceae bacterium]
MLGKEEYVEQAYFFRVMIERFGTGLPLQELMEQTKFELLATAKLPMAIDVLLAELKHRGKMHYGMELLQHYFVPFQTFLVAEAEHDRGRFDYKPGLQILAAEAQYRSDEKLRSQGLFFFQFEAISRNRLNYDRGLLAMSSDPVYSSQWSQWILHVRKQLGLLDLADTIYARSQFAQTKKALQPETTAENEDPILFGSNEGKIAWANRRKDPLFLFAAMQRHLGYPEVPKFQPVDTLPSLVPQLQRHLERLESRVKLLEDEQRSGIDITKFYGDSQSSKPLDLSDP